MRALLTLLLGGLLVLVPLPVDAAKDRDGDGVADTVDRCPDDPEDRDGFQDADGCPDPDNDADGIADVVDKCPNEPEDKDGFQDDDGCPDPDNDSDGIPDAMDRCPNEPETRNGFEDDDGCPDVAPKPSPGEAAREGTLEISVTPWANVVIDNKPYGRTPLRGVRLTAGPHQVILTRAERSVTKTIEIQAGKTSRLRIDL